MDNCFTCEVDAGIRPTPGGPVYSDDLWIADHGVPPLVRGYLVLKPRRPVPSLADLTIEEAAGLGTVSRSLMAAISAALQPDRVYFAGEWSVSDADAEQAARLIQAELAS